MSEEKYLLFDYGASHGRCLVAFFDGHIIRMEEIHEFDNVPVNYAGVLYWDILRLANELKIGIKKSCQSYSDIRSIGIDTWGCDFGYIDAQGKLLASPVNYRDEARHRYKNECDAFFGPYELFKMGGANLNGIMSIYELYANRREGLALLDVADRILMMPDLLNYYLTGVPVNDYTDATMSIMVNQTEKKWEKAIVDKLDIPERLFMEPVMPGTHIGDIRGTLCGEIGVPRLPVINVAGHDSASAIAGVPLIDDQEWAFLSLGTWAVLGIEIDGVIISERAYKEGFGNQGGCEGKTNFVALFTGLWVIQQCYERWCNDAGNRIGWEVVNRAVASAEGGFAFIDLDAHEFEAPNLNMPKVIQDYCRGRGQREPRGMGEIARCVYESLTLAVKKRFRSIQEISGHSLKTLYVIGGGSKNIQLCQWLADALNVPIKAGPAETTSVGNVLNQMIGLGTISSLAEGRAIAAESADTVIYEPSGSEVSMIWNRYEDAARAVIGD
jgi:sugar (pentulose or hexulose) kinase